ncbi:iron ABC transporter permease [Actinokineospora sp. UTMC 2448]|uniref:iron ABC transporter permease n=1 Tax=Actinokineospora sp. UTMC 2448 TaxID=2268449 RepID=UPI002164202A|nr:iron ABC transporter permease [Actinokineospora sp. UTMC 2448]UVS79730.1 Iron(III) dicitrate transport system permease protein FecD [Actinokineospora sp. UTMC 2448]
MPRSLAGPWALGLAVVVLGLAAVMVGQPFVGLNRLVPALLAADGLEHALVVQSRAPRAALALLAGAALGAAGHLLQESLRNPLAVPELLGVSSGAAAAVTVAVVFTLPVPLLAAAALGAGVGGSLTLLAIRRVAGPDSVLLAGAAVSAALQAVLLAAHSLSDTRDQGVLVRYLLGSLTGTTWTDVLTALPIAALAAPFAVLAVPALRVLRLGDEAAASAGLRPGRARLGVLAVACALVASVVAHCGPVAWVGFLAPRLAGGGLGRAAACGAVLVLGADLLARTVLYPVELPVGGLTAVLAVVAGLLTARRWR